MTNRFRFGSKSPYHISTLMLTMLDQLPGLSKPMLLQVAQKYDLHQRELLVLPVRPILLTSAWGGTVGNMVTVVGTMETLLCPVKLPTVASKNAFLQIV